MNSICFDTETTGLHPNGSDPDEILTISIQTVIIIRDQNTVSLIHNISHIHKP